MDSERYKIFDVDHLFWVALTENNVDAAKHLYYNKDASLKHRGPLIDTPLVHQLVAEHTRNALMWLLSVDETAWSELDALDSTLHQRASRCGHHGLAIELEELFEERHRAILNPPSDPRPSHDDL